MQGLADVVKKNYQNIALTDEWGILPIPIVTQMRINMHMFLCLCKLWKKISTILHIRGSIFWIILRSETFTMCWTETLDFIYNLKIFQTHYMRGARPQVGYKNSNDQATIFYDRRRNWRSFSLKTRQYRHSEGRWDRSHILRSFK